MIERIEEKVKEEKEQEKNVLHHQAPQIKQSDCLLLFFRPFRYLKV